MAPTPKNWEKTGGKAGPQIARYSNRILNRDLMIQERMGTYRLALYRERDNLENPHAVVGKASTQKEAITEANDWMNNHPQAMTNNETVGSLSTEEKLNRANRINGNMPLRKV